MSFAYAVALTGGIATGKSSVAHYFKTFGFEIIDADSIAHEILDTQYLAIQDYFGAEVIEGTRVNRKALGAIVFADEEKRKWLETRLHPLIYKVIEEASCLLDRKKKVYLVDIPLFFETKRYTIEKVLLVYTDKETQLARLMQRDSLSKEDALRRMASQMDIEQKRPYASYIIDNTGSKDTLYTACKRVKDEIEGDFI